MVVLGRLVKAVGLRGDLKLLASADFWEAALASGHLELMGPAGRTCVTIAAHRQQGAGTWVLRFAAFADHAAAQALVGSDLVLDGAPDVEPPTSLRPFQVRGLRCVLVDGTPLGVVEDLVAMPAHALLVVRGGERDYWVPAVEPILRRVDLEGGELVIDPPPGLLEL